jgi:uncharacterized protein with HEPN domain
MLMAARAAHEYVTEMDEIQTFVADRRTRDAVLYNLFVLGEAAKAVPADYRASHGEIEWRGIAGLRDVLAHQYFGVDHEVIWDVTKNRLPELIEMLEELLRVS